MNPSAEKTLSLVVPALNEESNLPILFQKALDVFPRYFKEFEILVVDDGSSDRTAEVVEEWGRRYPLIRLLRHPHNQGVGSALRDALKVSRFSWIFQSPGDNQFDLSEVKEFLPEMEHADLIQGWRTNLVYPPRRKVVTWVYRTLLRILFGLNFKDPTWVKMFRKEVAQSMEITTDGFFGEIEILIRAKRKGFRFREVGVHTQKRLYGQSTASSLSRVFRTFFELVRFRISLFS
ncbi:MAG: glycosyltransferase family 2 protein [Elusimicrobia bacterium]|nr:glycosyltransferase family 2 protein [Elusimicrobiota bacterium]